MDLKSLISKPTENRQNYWSVTIEPKWVSAAIWEIEDDAVKVIASGASSAWETEEDLVESCDTALSSAVSNLPENFKEPNKTVFGVTSSWVDGGNIKEEYLEKLKKVCQELSLEPTGFVVISEAIAHYIKVEEGSPLSSIIVGLAEDNLEVSLYKLGKLVGTTSVARSVSVVDDLVEGLVRFGTEDTYPSRIIVYDSKVADLEDVRTELTGASWEKVEKIKFLHTPRVEVLSPQNKVLAVSLAGASEMGGVTKVVENGINNSMGLPSEEVENVTAPKDNLTAEDLGFVVEGGEKVEHISHPLPQQETYKPASDNFMPEPKMETTAATKSRINLPQLPSFPKVSFPNLPKFSNPFKTSQDKNNFTKPLVIGGSTLLAFLVIGFLFWWFYPKADVVVFVSPKKLNESASLVLGTDLKTRSEEVVVSGQKTKSTTGTKTVGDKAKGSVKIQNGTGVALNLAAGTILVSSSDLKFTTTSSASVSGALTPTSPGTATVDVAAGNIGSEYNLAKDEVFKVANYPKADVDAVSTSDFSGGSSRQISAVAKEDLESLEKDLTAELLEDAKKQLEGKKTSEEVLIAGLISTEVTSSDFSNKAGDEATTLKLSLTLKVKGQMVSKRDLMAITTKSLEGKVPTGFVVRDDQVTYDFKPIEDNKEKVDIDMAVNLLPSVNPDDVAKKIVGKYPALAENYLKNVPGFVRAEFKVTPLFPGKLGTLPHLARKISVEIAAVR